MLIIGIVCSALFFVFLVAAKKLILRQMARLTSETERLASGDLSPVSGFEESSEEIASMAKALTIFRNGLASQHELQEKEREHEIARQSAEEKAEREELEREKALQAEKDHARRIESARIAAEEERLERIRKEKNEQERRQAAEQDAVVATPGTALDNLA